MKTDYELHFDHCFLEPVHVLIGGGNNYCFYNILSFTFPTWYTVSLKMWKNAQEACDILYLPHHFWCLLLKTMTSFTKGLNTFVFRHHNVDISVAVSAESGLITPIVFNADKKVTRQCNVSYTLSYFCNHMSLKEHFTDCCDISEGLTKSLFCS